MITMIPGNFLNEYYGLSTDEKPTAGVPNASQFYEMDTRDIYMFDKQNTQWIKQFEQ